MTRLETNWLVETIFRGSHKLTREAPVRKNPAELCHSLFLFWGEEMSTNTLLLFGKRRFSANGIGQHKNSTRGADDEEGRF